MKLTTITVEEETELVVPSAATLEEVLGDADPDALSEMDIVEREEVENQGAADGDVTDVYLIDVTLEAVAPEGTSLAFVESIVLWVEAPERDRVRVASGGAFPKGADRVSLDLEEVDLTDYVVAPSMTFVTELSGRSPAADTTLRATTVLELGVTTKGALGAAQRD